MSTERYYAPGKSGYRPGEVIAPDPDDLTEIGVMVFADRGRARLHAEGRSLYRVDPVGPLVPLKDEGSAVAMKARVVGVYDAHVTLSNNERNRKRRIVGAAVSAALDIAYKRGRRWAGE